MLLRLSGQGNQELNAISATSTGYRKLHFECESKLLWKPFRSAGINKMKLGLLVAKNRKLSPSAQKFVEAISKQLLLTGL